MTQDLAQLLVDEPGAVLQGLGEVPAELIDLLLDQKQGLVLFLCREEGVQAAQEKPSAQGHSGKD